MTIPFHRKVLDSYSDGAPRQYFLPSAETEVVLEGITWGTGMRMHVQNLNGNSADQPWTRSEDEATGDTRIHFPGVSPGHPMYRLLVYVGQKGMKT